MVLDSCDRRSTARSSLSLVALYVESYILVLTAIALQIVLHWESSAQPADLEVGRDWPQMPRING